MYGWAAAAIADDDGPCHSEPSWEITDSYAVAFVANSEPRLLNVEAAAIIGPAPAPAYMSPELISGGRAAKSKAIFIQIPSAS
jgi:hypothetical protein